MRTKADQSKYERGSNRLQATMGFAEVNETKLYYEMMGTGHPLVLINGGMMDCRMWANQFKEFAKHYEVIRYDHQGTGKSEMPKKPFYIINDLYNLLKYLKIQKAHIVGLSLGGSIAIQFTTEHPEMVSALLPAASGLVGFDWSPDERQRMNEIFGSVKDKNSALKAIETWLKNPYLVHAMKKPKLATKIRQLCLENYHSLLVNPTLSIQPKIPSIQRLSEIKTPTLIVVGDRDVPDILKIADTLEANISDAKKIVVEGAGHVINMEAPKTFNRIVLSFLRKMKETGEKRNIE